MVVVAVCGGGGCMWWQLYVVVAVCGGGGCMWWYIVILCSYLCVLGGGMCVRTYIHMYPICTLHTM